MSRPSRERPNNPRALRVESLCKDDAELQGRWPLAGMTRLAEAFAAAADTETAWTLRAHSKAVAAGTPELWLHLQASANVPLQCQRCLQSYPESLLVDRSIRFVHGEDLAARLDEELEDDVLSLPQALDLHELLEDELILALPVVPRHEGSCPQPLLAAVQEAAADEEKPAERPHPFAALQALKRGGTGGDV